MTKAENSELRECIELLANVGSMKMSLIQHQELVKLMQKLRRLSGE